MAELQLENLKLIMERVGNGNTVHDFAMWACRGEGRGCKRNQTRAKSKHCEDCLPTKNSETLGDVLDRLKRGDA